MDAVRLEKRRTIERLWHEAMGDQDDPVELIATEEEWIFLEALLDHDAVKAA